MLYAMQAALQRALAPLSVAADCGAALVGTSPLLPGATRRQLQAGYKLLNRLTRPFPKPSFDIEQVDGISVTEEVTLRLPFCELRHFAKDCKDTGPIVLLVAPLSGHHATLLRDTVKSLLADHDVYITDWTDAREVPLAAGSFDLSDYTRYVQSFIEHLGSQVHVVAVCQPCVPVLAAVSLLEQNASEVVPRSLTLIAGPVDTRRSPTEVNRFATDRDMSFFENKLIESVPFGHPGIFRRVYPGFMQLTGFVMMNKERHLQAYEEYYFAVANEDREAALRHEQFYDEYNAVLDMPAEYYLETIRKVFLDAQLAKGTLELCGRLVDPAAMRRTALLTVEGDKDDITGAGQTHVAHELCSALGDSMREQFTIEGAGHYGAFSGSKFRAQALPVITRFILQHSDL